MLLLLEQSKALVSENEYRIIVGVGLVLICGQAANPWRCDGILPQDWRYGLQSPRQGACNL